MSEQRNYHTVKKGDTLWQIAKDNGTTAESLKKINGIQSAHKINVGQRIALRKEAVCGVEALFLDRDRNPIKGLHFRMEQCGKTRDGTTGENGKSKQLFTETPDDTVKIWVKRLDGGWKLVTTVVSGFGNKLVTLVSAHMVIEAKTEKHPDLPPGTMPDTREKPKPTHGPGKVPSPTTDKKALGLKATSTKTPDGKALTVVEGDIPDLSFLGDYVGGEVTKEVIEAAAKELKCEPGLIYAIARQESAHSSFIKLGNRTVPSILYERHQFSKYSNRQYDDKYPDISSRQAYHKTKRKKVIIKGEKGKKDKVIYEVIDIKTGEAAVADDIYGSSGLHQYKRLVKAYQLDKEAALKACSWGKFQIMGFNHETAGYNDVFDFVKEMSTGDPAHIRAFLKFAKSNKVLLNGLREKDFEKISTGHNGDSWRDVNPQYASNLEEFYKEYAQQNKNK